MLLEKKPTSFTIAIASVFFIGTYLMTGCDCLQQADGVILDRQTKIPIDSLNIATVDILKNTVTGRVEYSIKNGNFKFTKMSGGIRKCPDLTLYFYKWGYNQTSLTFESSSTNDTIYLDKN
jgi:hypothetical protein